MNPMGVFVSMDKNPASLTLTGEEQLQGTNPVANHNLHVFIFLFFN